MEQLWQFGHAPLILSQVALLITSTTVMNRWDSLEDYDGFSPDAAVIIVSGGFLLLHLPFNSLPSQRFQQYLIDPCRLLSGRLSASRCRQFDGALTTDSTPAQGHRNPGVIQAL